ncbi:HeH/LEM domain-containing protein [Limosilactobacillus reuteri]|uniref:HeH/LEM domain-containing protein n=1 Tax=Limosilactobacillus reuteri TaxID=1598 RepID=UPI002D1FB2A0|nr:HeH/LEM domain-containing protein [Limosilactobacillus reuteri]MCC4405607.1 HeH/LEM domain-containing protein [Limosilactobacillus reuteri]
MVSPSGNGGNTTPSKPKTGGDTNETSQNKPASSTSVASSAPKSSSAAQPAVADTFNPSGDVKPTDAQTIPEIRAYLDAHKISYASSASKPDLLALANK